MIVEIKICGEAKEIADLVLALQSQRNLEINSKLKINSKAVAQALCDIGQEDNHTRAWMK